jgi:hypothetical protein
MQDNSSARKKMIRQGSGFGANVHSPIFRGSKKEEYEEMIAAFEKLRNNSLARFILTLMQFQR